jgi:arginyl-tRNA synthetase
MSIPNLIQHHCIESVKALYGTEIQSGDFQINQTRPEFEGDYTIVLFSLLKKLGKSPDTLGKELGEDLTTRFAEVYSGFNIIKGFLNLTISDSHWIDFLWSQYSSVHFGKKVSGGRKIMVEYSSPNTNKPLHLGHLRNIFLGWSVAEILKANGHELVKSCVVNDRGIHICKSMLAWQRYGQGQTPESTGKKGDHFVGDYYVKFNDALKLEIEELKKTGLSEEDAEKKSVLIQETRKMLQDWEAGDEKVLALWKMMNSWVYEGFDQTYRKIGADFDKVYYESDTYLLGKEYVMKGIEQGVFVTKEDGSVWINLRDEGLDEKLLLRKDGTSVYITQDIGLAKKKYDDYRIDESIYVIGDEQNYHMKILQLICKKLGLPYANDISHLSYGMVELPSGKMKSREGTVVDADDIIAEMENVAREKTEQLGKVGDFSHEELSRLTEEIGLGALKFFLLRVDPKKKMIFDPSESIDFQGFTAPFIQFNHARICSILRKSELDENAIPERQLLKTEKELILAMEQFPEMLEQAGKEHNPSVIAIYAYHLAKKFSSFYAELSIGNAETESKKQLRLRIAKMCANIIHTSMRLLGISVPERM